MSDEYEQDKQTAPEPDALPKQTERQKREMHKIAVIYNRIKQAAHGQDLFTIVRRSDLQQLIFDLDTMTTIAKSFSSATRSLTEQNEKLMAAELERKRQEKEATTQEEASEKQFDEWTTPKPSP